MAAVASEYLGSPQARPPSPFPLLSLPPELCTSIFTHCSQPTLLALLSTSSVVQQLALPVLYASPTFVADAGGFVTRLIDRPDLRPYLRTLISAVYPPGSRRGDPAHPELQELLWSSWLGPFSTIAKDCVGLRAVTLWGFGPPMALGQVVQALEPLRSLEYLELGHFDPSCLPKRPVRLPSVRRLLFIDLVSSLPNPGFEHIIQTFSGAVEVVLNLFLYTHSFRPADFAAFPTWTSVRSLVLQADVLPAKLLAAFGRMESLERLELNISTSPDPAAFEFAVPALVRCEFSEIEGPIMVALAAAVGAGRYPHLAQLVLGRGFDTFPWTDDEDVRVTAHLTHFGLVPLEDQDQSRVGGLDRRRWGRDGNGEVV